MRIIANRLQVIWETALALCIIPFIWLVFYSYPSIHDDYLGANFILNNGSWSYIKTNYVYWTGRYTELLIKAVLSPLAHKEYVLIGHMFTLSIIVLLFSAIYSAARSLIGKGQAASVSLLLTVMLFCGLTNISSFLYWSGGYTAYTAGAIFSIFFITLLYKLRQKSSLLNLVGCCVLIFLATGCYEVIMMIMLWVTLTNVVYSKFVGKGTVDAYILFAASIISALCSVLAPGNAARASGISNANSVFSIGRLIISACKSVFFATGSIVGWLDSALLLLGTLLIMHLLYRQSNFQLFSITIHPLLVTAWVLVGLSLSVFPSVFAYQAVWIHTWQCVYVFFLLGWLLVAYSIFVFVKDSYAFQWFVSNERNIWLVRILFLVFVFTSNTSNVNIAYLDLLRAPGYVERVKRRIESVQTAAKKNKIVQIRPLFLAEEKYLVPQTLYTQEYNQQDAQAFARYYGADSAAVAPCDVR